MKLIISSTLADNPSTLEGDLLLLAAGALAVSPAGADLTVVAGANGRAWGILSPSAAPRARAGGRVVVGRLVDLAATDLELDGYTYALADKRHAVRRWIADADLNCPICGLPIKAGDECLRCDCGLITDSLLCARGARPQGSDQCYRCAARIEV